MGADRLVKERASSDALDQIAAIFGLTDNGVADLFAVSRGTVARWRSAGIPAKRSGDVGLVRELATCFERKFIRARIPQIVRAPSRALGGKNVLAVITECGVDPVYDYLERLFSYSAR